MEGENVKALASSIQITTAQGSIKRVRWNKAKARASMLLQLKL
ncbi:hypothetical protein [Pedobacter nototheniae]|nr:hypothetical protein [Pedobacter nototheniae]